jgi:hypothetical protein
VWIDPVIAHEMMTFRDCAKRLNSLEG